MEEEIDNAWKRWIEEGIEPHNKNLLPVDHLLDVEDFSAVIHVAAKANNTEVIRYLIERQVHLDAIDIYGCNAVHICAENNCLEAARLLIQVKKKKVFCYRMVLTGRP